MVRFFSLLLYGSIILKYTIMQGRQMISFNLLKYIVKGQKFQFCSRFQKIFFAVREELGSGHFRA